MDIGKRIFTIIQRDDGTSLASRVFDGFITLLILASVVSVFAGTFDLSPGAQRWRGHFEAVASIIFTVEYLLRIWTANFLHPNKNAFAARLLYVISPMALVDLVAILPFWLPMFIPGNILGVRALRLVRLLRVLKLNRYFDALRSIGEVFVAKKRELVGSLFFLVLVLMVSSLLMYSSEHMVQPDKFQNAFSGIWWAVATLTTVGYGDLYPVTTLGRLLGIFIALTGVAALAIPTGIITSGLMERIGGDTAKRDACDRDRAREAARDQRLADLARELDEIKKLLAKGKQAD